MAWGYLALLVAVVLLVFVMVWRRHWGLTITMLVFAIGATIVGMGLLKASDPWVSVVCWAEILFAGIVCLVYKKQLQADTAVGLVMIVVALWLGFSPANELTNGWLGSAVSAIGNLPAVFARWLAGQFGLT